MKTKQNRTTCVGIGHRLPFEGSPKIVGGVHLVDNAKPLPKCKNNENRLEIVQEKNKSSSTCLFLFDYVFVDFCCEKLQILHHVLGVLTS